MQAIEFHILPPPEILKNDVECIRRVNYRAGDAFALKTSLNGLPGIVFQHHEGCSPVKKITTRSGCNRAIPTLYLYGQITEPSVMDHHGPYTMTQVLLKPHALQTLFGLNASSMTGRIVELNEFTTGDFNLRLLETNDQQEHLALLTEFLAAKLKQERRRDRLVEESLRLIHNNRGCVQIKALLEQLSISERHFARRFNQTVGLSPHFYLRVQRFKEAVRLVKTQRFARLTDVAHTLNFHDESHFIRDVKAFSGMTPKSLLQKENDYLQGQAGYFYL